MVTLGPIPAQSFLAVLEGGGHGSAALLKTQQTGTDLSGDSLGTAALALCSPLSSEPLCILK